MLSSVRDALLTVGRQEWPAIHEATGVPLSSIEKVAYGVHEDPRISTIEPLARYFSERRATA
jgi:hypothetical protein